MPTSDTESPEQNPRLISVPQLNTVLAIISDSVPKSKSVGECISVINMLQQLPEATVRTPVPDTPESTPEPTEAKSRVKLKKKK